MKGMALILLVAAVWLRAGLAPAPVFSDHMVLQREQPLPVWGRAEPGASVLVEFAGDRQTDVADADGRWIVRLGAKAASATPRLLRISTSNESRELTDVLVGDVWICAGQSNMEWPLGKELHADREVPMADRAYIRFFNPGYAGKDRGSGSFTDEEIRRLTPEDFYRGTWERCTAQTAASMSAVGYYAARDLQAALAVPVGILQLAVGGSPTEAWIPREALAADPVLRELVEGNWLANPMLEPWCRQRGHENLDRAIAAGGTIPGSNDGGGPNHAFKPGFLWAAGLEPWRNLSLRGVLWYQGESNSLSLPRVRQHEILLPLLVREWRHAWGRQDLPFLYCQLSGIEAMPYHSEFWPEFRDSQRRLLSIIPDSGMVVTADAGDRRDVHPRNKAVVGQRLARVALAKVYGRLVEYSGPEAVSASAHPRSLVIRFTHATDGLITSDGAALRGFELAGNDGQFTPVSAVIEGTTVVLALDAGFTPRRVRYAWQPFPEGNLTNGCGLPASTFALDVDLDPP